MPSAQVPVSWSIAMELYRLVDNLIRVKAPKAGTLFSYQNTDMQLLKYKSLIYQTHMI